MKITTLEKLILSLSENEKLRQNSRSVHRGGSAHIYNYCTDWKYNISSRIITTCIKKGIIKAGWNEQKYILEPNIF